MKQAFRDSSMGNTIIEAKNGKEALEVLHGTDRKQRLLRPYIVLLDLNMPVMNGHSFLDAVRADSNLDDIIVFVLTTSSQEGDISQAYHNQIAGYLLKHRAGEDFSAKITLLDNYISNVEILGESRSKG